MSGEKRRTLQNQQKTEDNRMQQRLQELERTKAKEMKRLEEKLKKEQENRIKKMERTIEKKTRERLSNLNKVQEEQLKHQEKKLIDKISKIDSAINSIQKDLHERYEKEEEISQAWMAKLHQILFTISDNYDHQKHTPGVLENLQSKVSHVQELYQNGQYQAVTATSSQTYFEAENLLLDLERLTIEFQQSFYQIIDQLHHLKSFLKEGETTPFTLPTISGEEHTYHIPVDYWTFQGLTPIKELIRSIEGKLIHNESLTISQLKVLAEEMDTIPSKIQDQINEARSRYYSQVYATDIQEVIAEKLTEQGFKIIGNEQEDEREANVLLLERRGEKVMTILDYDVTKKAPEFMIRFNSPHEDTRQERLDVILKTINKELGTDLKPEEMKATPGYEHKPVEDDKLVLKKIHGD